VEAQEELVEEEGIRILVDVSLAARDMERAVDEVKGQGVKDNV